MNTRLLFALILFVILDIYAFQTFRGALKAINPDFRKFLYFGYWGLSAVAYFLGLGMTFKWFAEDNQFITIYGRTFLMILFFGKLISIPALLIDDIRRMIVTLFNHFSSSTPYDPSRSRFLSGLGLALGAAPIALLTYGTIRNPYRYKKTNIEIPIDNLPPGLEGFKIIQISDIHSGSFVFKEPINNAIEIINKENADLVVFTGDIVNNKSDELEPLIGIFSKIKTKSGQPVYAILGNHDYGTYYKWEYPHQLAENMERLKGYFKEMNWRLLLNENVSFPYNGASINIIGVENFSALPQFPKHGDLHKASENLSKADVNILLSHDPTHWDYEINTKYPHIDLTLSGHTHGFQFGIEIPGWIKWSPSKMIYKQWAGLYQKGKQYLYVNRGLGFLGYAGRIGILPEITVIKLTNKSSNKAS